MKCNSGTFHSARSRAGGLRTGAFAVAVLATFSFLPAGSRGATPPGLSDTIHWSRDVLGSIARAKKEHRPLVLWIQSTRTRRHGRYGYGSAVDQRSAFGNPRVVFAARNFIPITAQRGDGGYTDLFRRLGIPVHTGSRLVFLTPSGRQLGQTSSLQDATRLVRTFTQTFRTYRSRLYKTDLKKRLEADQISDGQVKHALRLVNNFVIEEADQSVLDLLDRPDLTPALRAQCFQVLATLSTRAAAQRLLFDAARGSDAIVLSRLADGALRKSTPQAAKHLIEFLDDDDRDLRLTAYRAVTSICKIPRPRSLRFWERASEPLQVDEIERVRQLVKQRAQRWQEQVGKFR